MRLRQKLLDNLASYPGNQVDISANNKNKLLVTDDQLSDEKWKSFNFPPPLPSSLQMLLPNKIFYESFFYELFTDDCC